MNDVVAIARDRVLPPAQDYTGLRELGVRRIQALSGALWTNHNSPDPGITILEALAYAITDLGYRTGFATEDLLTRPDGLIGPPSETGLFPAHEALTCSPLTIADHRQVLLRVRDVRNAWLDPMQNPAEPTNYRLSEVPIYADCKNDRLTYEATVDQQATHPVRLSGLYKVLVSLETDPVLGSLNETALPYTFKSGTLKGVRVTIDSQDAAFLAGQIDFAPAFTGLDGAPTAVGEGAAFTAAARVILDDGTTVTFDALRIDVTEDRPRPTADPVTVTAAELAAELGQTGPDAILRLFWDKQRRRQRSLARVGCVLNAHRPLCEDWLSIATIAPYRVGICADIDLAPEADLERVQAEIFHAIELYLNPPVRWRTLASLLDVGVPADEIFDGPYIDFDFQCGGETVFTKPGFLTREDLEACELRRAVHSSDIINLVVDIDGVLGIRGLTLRAYDAAGAPLGATEAWTLAVPPGHQPVLFFEGSKIVLFKSELPYRAQELEFRRTLDHLRAMSEAALYVPPGQILPAVVGRWRGIDAAYSVQNDLPRLYGVGRAGLAPEEPATRFAQARQLKGYLTHFDWLLADYLGQLAAVRRLLSPDATLAQTYFPQPCEDAAGTLLPFEDEFYIDQTRLADNLYRARLTESEETFLDRRARALDHLLARFAERFADYALMSFRLSGDSIGTARDLIADRAAFLAEAPVLSRERSLGFDYRPEDPARVWNTDNVPGLQKRVARLLGIADYTRRDLHCAALFDALIDTSDADGDIRVRIAAGDGTALFLSEETFASVEAALDAARLIFARLRGEAAYEIDASGGVNAVILRLSDGAGVVLTNQQRFETAGDAARRAREIVLRYDQLLQSPICDSEGVHVIEHILLRPRRDGDRLMQVCLPSDCDFCGEQDPYSFRLHVVFPYWPARFQDLGFRRYAERLIREETPAHILPRICWVGNEEMRELDAAWRAWLELQADPDADPGAVSGALAELIGALERLRTVYPPATLHDCDEGEEANIVRLDATNLGLF
jgi:hypothetical protein